MPTSFKDNPMLLRNIIMDHYENPRNREEVNDTSYKTIHMDSDSCIDDIFVQVKVENGEIKDCKWHGVCCAISTASTSIMTELVKGKSVKEAENIAQNFYKMLKNEEFEEEKLGEAIAFINTSAQPSRIGCATIGWRGFDKAIQEDSKDEEGRN